MKKTVLKVTDVTKTIKKRKIIKGISMEVNQGEVLGFLGPNGAGKSTTLRMIVGLSKPTSGHIAIDSHDIQKNYVQAMSQVGCIIEGPDMYNNMSGYKNLEMLNVMGHPVTKEEIMEAVDLVGMTNRIHDKVKVYSMGMKQRLALAAALLHKPKLLILDEPTNGLDPQGIYEFRMIIKKLADDGISVLISSHLISEVQLMCDKVSIINNGEIIRHDHVDNLLHNAETMWKTDDVHKTFAILKTTVENIRVKEDAVVGILPEAELAKINRQLVENGVNITQVARKEQTLEELFLQLTEYDVIQ